MVSQQSDVHLLREWMNGNAQAAEKLVCACHDNVRRFIIKGLFDRGCWDYEFLADEIVQKSFKRAFESAHEFTYGSFFTWVCEFAKNYIKAETTSQKKFIQRFYIPNSNTEDSDQENPEDNIPANEENQSFGNPEIIFIREETKNETRQLIAGTLNTLKPQHKEIIIKSRILELNNEEIAKELGLTIDAVKSRYRRAAASFRRKYILRLKSNNHSRYRITNSINL